ncbi:MAG: LTA synthase family protein, partial [Anaerovoracaceae bacterium]
KLMKENSSGLLTVPTMGAGTANTEFEAITGMRAKFFGPGEYPYKTVLPERVAESFPFDLKAESYSTHAIHNHRGLFYGRNKVYANLGFDTYTSLEYMTGVEKTQKNWAKDEILTNMVKDALNSTPGKDYIYTITVQEHGQYPKEAVYKDPKIKITNAPSDEIKYQYEYYVNHLNETDAFVQDLIDEMKNYNEEVVVVMFGDHLPAIENLTDETLTNRNSFQTDYFIWSNFDMQKNDKNLFGYQLAPELFSRIGINKGALITYHQKHSNDKDYLKNLEALQYDMLYGKRYLFQGDFPFKATALQMGVKEIKINSVFKIGKKYYISGENFTEFSKINLDGKILKTVYLSPTLLGVLEEVEPKAASRMKVSQVEKSNEILSTSE